MLGLQLVGPSSPLLLIGTVCVSFYLLTYLLTYLLIYYDLQFISNLGLTVKVVDCYQVDWCSPFVSLMGITSAIGQPTRPTQPFILSGVDR